MHVIFKKRSVREEGDLIEITEADTQTGACGQIIRRPEVCKRHIGTPTRWPKGSRVCGKIEEQPSPACVFRTGQAKAAMFNNGVLKEEVEKRSSGDTAGKNSPRQRLLYTGLLRLRRAASMSAQRPESGFVSCRKVCFSSSDAEARFSGSIWRHLSRKSCSNGLTSVDLGCGRSLDWIR